MADIYTRPYTPNYSGLINQTAVGAFLLGICWLGYELMRGARRHREREPGWGWRWKERLGSVESWEFGYLYQARCWSLRPSVRLPRWSLWWIEQVLMFPEDKLPEMIGIDQAFYCRFIRGCWWFTLLHTFTTLPIILPINVVMTSERTPARSMTRASLSELIESAKGIHLLWIHQLVLYWLLITWLVMFWWLARGLWRWRERAILRAKRALETGVSVLSPLPAPLSKGEKKKAAGRSGEFRAVDSKIKHAQEGDLESSSSFVRGEPLEKSLYNQDSGYLNTENAPYANIHSLHPLPPSSHPHTPYAPSPTGPADRGLRLRTVMVSNVPVGMRNEVELKEYFEYYMSRPVLVPAITPGYLPRLFNWVLHRKPARAAAKRVMGEHVKRLSATNPLINGKRSASVDGGGIATPPNGALKRDGEPHADFNPKPLNDPHVGVDFAIIDSRPVSPSQDTNAPPPIIERVTICRKMTELANLLERREEYLRKLEAAHIKLARKTLEEVKLWIEGKGKIKLSTPKRLSRTSTQSNPNETSAEPPAIKLSPTADAEHGFLPSTRNSKFDDKEQDVEAQEEEDEEDDEMREEKERARMDLLARELAPFIEEFYADIQGPKLRKRSLMAGKGEGASPPWAAGLRYNMVNREASDEGGVAPDSADPILTSSAYPPASPTSPVADSQKKTIWHVLHGLPRRYLDPYQPLVSLSTLFRGETVGAIDYYHSKVGLLTSLINENRSKPHRDLIPTSTAFVTFHSPKDARRCVRQVYLPNHPDNILACIAEPAPDWRDLDWHRIGRSSFTGEFLRDWIVKAGVWGFTLFWILPVSALVALVSVDKISSFIPGLAQYFDAHQYQKELISAFVPTLLVALLAILVPLLLLLIGKQAHTILTLSKLHDTIMVRYYKFLVCNVLVFFCIGTAALNSILDQIRRGRGISGTGDEPKDAVSIVATSFPNGAPFYVGWLVFQAAMHSGLELGLYGLPLMVYPSTRASASLRRREVGIRPRTYNFYYWLPNHVMVMMIVIVFTVLNPLVIPFALIYFSFALAVHKNQLMRVYSKWYDQNGSVIIIRIFRYTLDGFIFAEIVFLALNILTRRSHREQDADVINANFGLTGILLAVTIGIKIYFTTVLRGKLDEIDVKEADVYHNPEQIAAERGIAPVHQSTPQQSAGPSEIKSIEEAHESPQQEESAEPTASKVEFHPGSVRLWNWRLPTEEDFAYKSLPGRVIGRPTSPRGPIPFETEPSTSEDEPQTRRSSGSSSKHPPVAYPRRWSVGAIGSPGVSFPKELADVVEGTSPPISPTTATSVAPLLAQASALEQAQQSMERGEEATTGATSTLDAHGRGRPGIGRATISFDTPPVIIREKKMSTASSSAASKSIPSRPSTVHQSYIELPAAPGQTQTTESTHIPLIQPHPKTGPWDDSPRYDIPYQNPAYTCPIDDFLWLPRNPCGKLNLDDSIEMRKAIRTEPELGAMGEWVDDGTSFDVIPRNTVNTVAALPGTLQNPNNMTIMTTNEGDIVTAEDDAAGGIPMVRRVATTSTVTSRYTQKILSGMEHIHLPPGIRARIRRKTADEFGYKRTKWTTSAILAGSPEEVEPSEGTELKQEGYMTVKERRPSVSRPGLLAQMKRPTSSRYAASGARTEGHASTSTLGVHRRVSVHSSRSGISRITQSTEDPALYPDLSEQSPFADPDLQIVMTRSNMGRPPPSVAGEDLRRAQSMFVTSEEGVAGPSRHPLHEMGMRRIHSQGVLGGPPPTRVVRRKESVSAKSSGGRSSRKRGDSISVRDAIAGEVLAEEQIATERRLQAELAEAQRLAGTRSYWTGWMWRTVPNTAPSVRTGHSGGGGGGGDENERDIGAEERDIDRTPR
ncbi:hypothetical protein CPB86DRAFT_699009 [Serendipita vermifera]|nr:hypothetical protein CPB86DRAFT_699009 [Serendipita vermifera]